jgi:hypothetical protein
MFFYQANDSTKIKNDQPKEWMRPHVFQCPPRFEHFWSPEHDDLVLDCATADGRSWPACSEDVHLACVSSVSVGEFRIGSQTRRFSHVDLCLGLDNITDHGSTTSKARCFSFDASTGRECERVVMD